jgi:hypothetical protein
VNLSASAFPEACLVGKRADINVFALQMKLLALAAGSFNDRDNKVVSSLIVKVA